MLGGLVLDYICSVKYETFFTIARLYLDTRKKFMILFGNSVFKMKLDNSLVRSFLIGIGLVIGFQLQREITQILESISSTNSNIMISQSMWLYDSKFDPHHLQ